ncbi:unnamed protein product [Durusdinium trenchii]|uniref:Fucosyltransferase n=1 Tax=Durusdinium trenchii TaxID=1381693 RepID=A0ABP0L3U0_9DINO
MLWHSWHFVPLFVLVLTLAKGDQAACDALKGAWSRAAESGLRFYASGSSTGAALTEPVESRAESARNDLQTAAVLAAELDATEACGPNASLAQRLFWLLLQSREDGRKRIAEGHALDPEMSLLSPEPSWVELLHSGWPVFSLAALVESEFRDPPTYSLAATRLGRQEPSEECNGDQEVFHHISMLFAAEGRTARLIEIRDFLRTQVDGDVDLVAGPQFFKELMHGVQGSCPAAQAVGYAALADALQCHWRRPSSHRMHELADVAVAKAQQGALKAFGHGPGAFNVMMRSRWPLLSFLARLHPRTGPSDLVVSWSSREAELGGTNWAQNFAKEVFGDRAGVHLEEDVECADIYVYRSKVPVNFGGVLIFVDGERSPEDSLQETLLRSYPASIVVGPMAAGGLSDFFLCPAASTSFSARLLDSPMRLVQPRPLQVRPGFAAYLVYRCYPHRERFFHLLDSAAKEQGLGSVESLSRCGNAPPDIERRSKRYSASYYDDAVELFRSFRFAMVFENRLSPRYVTEKIVNAFLSGAIPIYWGSPFVLKIFNPMAFIYVNSFRSFEAAVEHILRVASDPELFALYATAPVLRNTSIARWLFSWHRNAPPLLREEPTLREALATLAFQKHHEGLRGTLTAVERRPFDYAHLFPP